jgi:hypothetical protein
MKRNFFDSKVWLTFVDRSPFFVVLSDPDYALAVDSDPKHFEKENAHWHLCHHGKPIARISAYGCWMSWPKVPTAIRLEAEEITSRMMIKIIRVCGKNPISDSLLLAACRPD